MSFGGALRFCYGCGGGPSWRVPYGREESNLVSDRPRECSTPTTDPVAPTTTTAPMSADSIVRRLGETEARAEKPIDSGGMFPPLTRPTVRAVE